MPKITSKFLSNNLYDMAKKHDLVSEVCSSLELFYELIGKNSQFKSFLQSKKIRNDEKVSILKEILSEEINPLVFELILYVKSSQVVKIVKEVKENGLDDNGCAVADTFSTPEADCAGIPAGNTPDADGDMICQTDIKELLDLKDNSKALQVVKHNYKTKAHQKYLGNINQDYPRKNWSSVILWNCAHPKHKILKKMSKMTKSKQFNDSAFLVYEQALIAENIKLENPIEFIDRMNRALEKSL